MDQLSCAGSFLLGGLSAITVMGLLLFFMESPTKKSKETQELRTIVRDFLGLAQFKQTDEIPTLQGEGTSEDSQNQNFNERISIVQRLAAGKLGKEYTPVSGLLQ
jgi:hypothetical protein